MIRNYNSTRIKQLYFKIGHYGYIVIRQILSDNQYLSFFFLYISLCLHLIMDLLRIQAAGMWTHDCGVRAISHWARAHSLYGGAPHSKRAEQYIIVLLWPEDHPLQVGTSIRVQQLPSLNFGDTDVIAHPCDLYHLHYLQGQGSYERFYKSPAQSHCKSSIVKEQSTILQLPCTKKILQICSNFQISQVL